MNKWLCVLVAMALIASLSVVMAQDDEKENQKEEDAAEKRAKIDEVAQEALDTLFSKSDGAKSLYEDAYGYAVFDNLKIAFGISGGGGSGVAVSKGSGARTYMKMGTGGIGLGLGGQKYQVVFFFETEKGFTSFVEKGWKAEAGARAAAGTEGASADTTFHNGMAIYQMNETGLMANADISGTKYWKNKKLNEE
jgi:lipid-binding SYLF domain-containing protein